MKNIQLVTNLDFLRKENKMDEYIEQYYFFLELAVSNQELELLKKLLVEYTREIIVLDNRSRLADLLAEAEHFILLLENLEYQADYFLIMGNLHYASLNFHEANQYYKKAISRATQTKNFRVLGIAMNNMMTSNNDVSEYNARLLLSPMASVFISIGNSAYPSERFMILIHHIELAIRLEQYDYAKTLLQKLSNHLSKTSVSKRELFQLELVNITIYYESKQYEEFLNQFDQLEEKRALHYNYDLRSELLFLVIETAKKTNQLERAENYKKTYDAILEQANEQNSKIQTSHNYTNQEKLLEGMIPFDELSQKCNLKIQQNELVDYSVVMFHIVNDHITMQENEDLKQFLHNLALKHANEYILMSTMLSAQKFIYISSLNEQEIGNMIRTYFSPAIEQYRKRLNKEFKVIVSTVHNLKHGYKTFDQVLQHAYSCVYYASYNQREAILNG